MDQINNGDTGSSVRTKLNELINRVSAEVTFENSDLDGSSILTKAHGLGRLPAAIMVVDNTGTVQNANMTATTTQVTVDCGGAITGTWTLVVI